METHGSPSTTDTENGCLKPGRMHVWKFVHMEDYSYTTPMFKGRNCKFNWLEISKDGTITVKGSYKKGYAWDGCTPKKNFLDFTWGTPDGKLIKFGEKDYKPVTYYASMVHDVLYQYKRCVPVTRKEADLLFFQMLKEAGFQWVRLYYWMVRSFGWLYSGWKYKGAFNPEN